MLQRPSPTKCAPAIKQALGFPARYSGKEGERVYRSRHIATPLPASASRILWGRFYLLALRAPAVGAAAPGVMVMFDTISRPLDPEENLRDGVVDVAIDWLPVQLESRS